MSIKKKTHEEYVAELAVKNPNLEVIEKYVDNKTKILHRCKIDGYEWRIVPSSILQGHGCPKCSGKVRMTHIEYVNELFKINSNIEVIEKYKGVIIPIKHHCKKHDIYWNAIPSNILRGHECPECGKEKNHKSLTMTLEQYKERLKRINPNIIAVGEYINSQTPVLHKCLIDNYEWNARPANILFGKGCPKCAGNYHKTHKDYVNEAFIINPNIEVSDKYINATIPILHKCLIDGYEWKAAPFSILRGSGCPKCNESKGEKQIASFLDDRHITYEGQKKFKNCRDVKPLPFDFYLPDYNKCIEFDGMQHYKPIQHFGGEKSFQVRIKHDQIKNEYCKNNGISLLRIPYFKNIEEELNNFLFI